MRSFILGIDRLADGIAGFLFIMKITVELIRIVFIFKVLKRAKGIVAINGFIKNEFVKRN